MYRLTVRLSDQRPIVVGASARRSRAPHRPTLLSRLPPPMCEPTLETSMPSSARRRRTSRTRSGRGCGRRSPTCQTITRSASTARSRSSCSTGSGTPRRRRSTRTRVAGADRLGDAPVVRAASHPLPRGKTVSAGRTVLVTGGSRGIGKAIALRLAREGATRVAIGYFRSDSRCRGDRGGAARARRGAGARAGQRHLVARRWSRSRRSGRSTSSSTTRRPASSGPRSRPRTSTGTGRSTRTRARCSR